MNVHVSLTRTILLCATLLMALSASAQWTNINTLSNHAFYDINFPSSQKGYAIVGDGGFSGDALYKTENAGVNWEEITLNLDSITMPHLQSIYFVNDQTGFMSLRSRINQLKIFLLKTQDGGSSWSDVTPDSLPVGYGISDVFFTDQNQGFVTSGERLYRTSDGGDTWAVSLNLRWEGFNDIHFYDANFGIVGAWDGTFAYQGRIFTTSNGGQSWDSLYLPDYGSSIGRVMHVGDSTAFAMTDHGWGRQKIHMTTNNGNSWDTLSLQFLSDSSDIAVDFYFEDISNGYLITSNGKIFKTNDCGKTWIQEYVGAMGLRDLASNGDAFFAGGPINTLLNTPNTLGIGDPAFFPNGFVYPNPCSRSGILNFQQGLSGELRLLEMNGRLIVSKNLLYENQLSIQGLELVPGTYFIQLIGEKVKTSKIVISE